MTSDKIMQNNNARRNSLIVWGIVATLLIIDQLLKIWVKTDFYLGESREVTSWFSLTFVENNGMAFGWSVGSKIFLTLFRVAFIVLLAYGLLKGLKAGNMPLGFLICLGLVFAGAVGNIIDCLFYGIIFNNPAPPETATLFCNDITSAGFLEGRVVDMFSFHIFSFEWPQWIPLIGGKNFDFFGPIFNIADAAISVGVIALIIFYAKRITPFLELYRRKKCPGDATVENTSESDTVEKP